MTDDAAGDEALAEAADRGFDVYGEPMAVYQTDSSTLVVDAGSTVTAFVGENAEGDDVTVLAETTAPVEAAGQPGFQAPPRSAWDYNNDGDYYQSVGDNWFRKGFWTINKANNYRFCDTCAAHDYYRMVVVLVGGLKDPDGGRGIRRLWADVTRDDNGTSPTSFELAQPDSVIRGPADTTKTIGFSGSVDVQLGVPPLVVGGEVSTSYTSSLSYSSEQWFPVNQGTNHAGDGGAQWCRNDGSSTIHSSRKITYRVGYRVSAAQASPPGWTTLRGMSESSSNCPDA